MSDNNYLIVYLHQLNFCMTFILITLFLLIPYAVLILYYRKSWISIKDFIPKEKMNEKELPYVSIIIAARNEEKNIGKCIKSLVSQTYPQNKFEVIITDDHSTDQTVPIIKSFSEDNIRVISLADFTGNNKINSYKKKSIETALKFAKGELIVTTDADCIAPQKWLETLVSFYKKQDSGIYRFACCICFCRSEGENFKTSLKDFSIARFYDVAGNYRSFCLQKISRHVQRRQPCL